MIFILSATLIYLILSIVMDISFGNRGKRGHIKRYYAYLSGEKIDSKPWFKTLLGLNEEQLKYEFDSKKYFLYIIPICSGIFVFVLFFFRSWQFALLISLIGLFYPRWIISGIIEKRKNLLNLQLKEAMFALSSSLSAGASLQGAIERSVHDLERIFRNPKEAPVVHEFRRMAEDLRIGYSLDETLVSFRNRVNLEDVDDFVNATLITKRRGGNLREVLGNIAKVISEKIEIKNEIIVMTAGKRLESRILSILPIGIVTCLALLSPEYISPMYDTFAGRVLLFTGFILIGLNYWVSKHIIKINV